MIEYTKIIFKDKLLWFDDCIDTKNIVGTASSDNIARANGFQHIEQLIKNYPDGYECYMDKYLKIHLSKDVFLKHCKID